MATRQAAGGSISPSSWSSGLSQRLAVLRLLIAFSITSTALHFTHNYIHIAHYPPSDLVTNAQTRVAILISWPVLTALGVLGYWLYSRGRNSVAYACLLAYSLLGIATLGHFTAGSPHIGPFWYATIFTDGFAGIAIAAFVAWSAVMGADAAHARQT
jgi:hypothetical protein